MEAAVRNLAVTLVLMSAIGFAIAASARDINLQKFSADEVKSACTKAGGSFSEYSGGYGCGTDCHGKPGTACLVDCKTGERCVAQVIGGRRPKNLLSALQVPERGH